MMRSFLIRRSTCGPKRSAESASHCYVMIVALQFIDLFDAIHAELTQQALTNSHLPRDTNGPSSRIRIRPRRPLCTRTYYSMIIRYIATRVRAHGISLAILTIQTHICGRSTKKARQMLFLIRDSSLITLFSITSSDEYTCSSPPRRVGVVSFAIALPYAVKSVYV